MIKAGGLHEAALPGQQMIPGPGNGAYQLLANLPLVLSVCAQDPRGSQSGSRLGLGNVHVT